MIDWHAAFNVVVIAFLLLVAAELVGRVVYRIGVSVGIWRRWQ